MAKEGYPWPCERDGINTADVASNPNCLATERTHEEWHNSESGLTVEKPDYAQPAPTKKR